MKLRNKKTGLTGILTCIDFNIDDSESEIDLSIMLDNSDGECIDRQFYSLDELKKFLRDWEECKPAEPLIKDEKARKIVRAWAEYNNTKSVYAYNLTYDHGGVCIENELVRFYDSRLRTSIEIWFVSEAPTFEDIEYTITELCGKEEK